MKCLLLLSLIVLVGLVASREVNPAVLRKQFFDKISSNQFKTFKLKYKKEYKSVEEEEMRFRIFKDNLKLITKLNAKSKGGNNFGITKFSDLTQSEFSHLYLMPKRPVPVIEDSQVLQLNVSNVKIPESWDWRTQGLKNGKSCITDVYNQGQCGSCWAFSATEEIESMECLQGFSKDGPDHLSMQQIVDCDKKAYGCDGGWTYVAYEYVMGAGGLDSLKSYPYTAKNGRCDFKKADVEAKVAKWSYVTKDKDEAKMRDFVGTTGPLSICVDASSWQFYQSGVLRHCGKEIDHCVQIVGYKKEDNIEAWIVRNSWGTDWGIEGYILVEYGKDMCAIAQVVTTIEGEKQ